MSNLIDRKIVLIVNDKKTTFQSKSDAIRKLDKSGLTRSKIVEVFKTSGFDIKYQMVRNIIVNFENTEILKSIRQTQEMNEEE